VIRELSQGEYFGEFAPMFWLPRSATARAGGPTIVTGAAAAAVAGETPATTPASRTIQMSVL
jgi:CRP-like cAMP-binding protein